MKFEEIMKNLTLIQNYVNAWYKPINDEEYRRVYTRINELLEDTKHKIEGADLPDKETCNPKICKWCKYNTNGKRDPARSISMCDGCRYNEEFEHL